MLETPTKTLADAGIGDGATFHGWSDSHPATIIARTERAITVQGDTATLLNGPSSGEPDALIFHPGGFCGHVEGTQRYEYASDPEGSIRTFTLRKNGRWVRRGDDAKTGLGLTLGRFKHYDYGF